MNTIISYSSDDSDDGVSTKNIKQSSKMGDSDANYDDVGMDISEDSDIGEDGKGSDIGSSTSDTNGRRSDVLSGQLSSSSDTSKSTNSSSEKKKKRFDEKKLSSKELKHSMAHDRRSSLGDFNSSNNTSVKRDTVSRRSRSRSKGRRFKRRDFSRSKSRDRQKSKSPPPRVRRKHRSRSRDHRRSRSRSRDRRRSRSRSRDRRRSQSRSRDRRRSRSRSYDRRRSRSRSRGYSKRRSSRRSRSRSGSRSRRRSRSRSSRDRKRSKSKSRTRDWNPDEICKDSLNSTEATKPTEPPLSVEELIKKGMEAQMAIIEKNTGLKLPTYYNPAVMNPLKLADQERKKKLLWGNKSKPEPTAVVMPIGGVSEPAPGSSTLWSQTKFINDSDGKMADKFRRLMGVKAEESGAQISTNSSSKNDSTDMLKKQESLFSNMEQQYEVARMTTHTHRGFGLGFSNQPYLQPK